MSTCLPLLHSDASVHREHPGVDLDDLLENGGVGLMQLSADGTVAWANRPSYEPLGLERAEFVGHPLRTFTDHDGAEELMRRLHAGETIHGAELALRRRDGSTRHVLVTASGRSDEHGRLLHARCGLMDVPGRQSSIRLKVDAPAGDGALALADELLEAERRTEQLQMIADALPVLIAYIGSDLRYRFANLAYSPWFGRKREEIDGMSMVELLGPVAFESLKPHVARVLAGDSVTFEAVVPYREAGVRSIRANYVPHQGQDGRIEGFVALVSDISKEQRAALEREGLLRLEQSARERLSVLARASDLLGQTLDYERTLESIAELALPTLGDFGIFDIREGDGLRRFARAYHNDRVQQLVEQACWQPGGENANDLWALASGRSGFHPRVDDGFAQRMGIDDEHGELLRQLGVRSMLTVPLTSQRETLGALTLFYGWSGRHHTEHDLALAEELARRAAAAIVNARLFKEAREAIGVRDDFLSIAGHELRTPLTALQLQILSITKMAQQPDSAAKVADRAEKAGRNVLRLSNLVNELLDISRISAGRLRLERTAFDLGDAVREVVARHADELQRNGCELRLATTPGTLGSWDRVRLEQVTTNLLANAMKYGKGKPIEVTVEPSAGTARLIVRDHGIGIPPEDQQRIFQRFERAVSSRHFGGLGLGLWIARQLVDAHGGTIQVTSDKDQGATFEVSLPMSSPEEVAG